VYIDAVASYAQELFDVVACYFPITFTPPPNDPHGITKEGLVGALRRVFAATPRLADWVLPLLVEKLESTVPDAQRDAAQTLVFCAARYGVDALMPHLPSLCDALRGAVVGSAGGEGAAGTSDGTAPRALLSLWTGAHSGSRLSAALAPVSSHVGMLAGAIGINFSGKAEVHVNSGYGLYTPPGSDEADAAPAAPLGLAFLTPAAAKPKASAPVPDEALVAIAELTRLLSLHVQATGSVEEWHAFVSPLIRFGLTEVSRAPESQVGFAASRILCAVASASHHALASVLEAVMPAIARVHADATAHCRVEVRCAVVGLLSGLLHTIDHGVDHPPGGHPVSRHIMSVVDLLHGTLRTPLVTPAGDSGSGSGSGSDEGGAEAPARRPGAGGTRSVPINSSATADSEARCIAAAGLCDLAVRPPSALLTVDQKVHTTTTFTSIVLTDRDDLVREACLRALCTMASVRQKFCRAVLNIAVPRLLAVIREGISEALVAATRSATGAVGAALPAAGSEGCAGCDAGCAHARTHEHTHATTPTASAATGQHTLECYMAAASECCGCGSGSDAAPSLTNAARVEWQSELHPPGVPLAVARALYSLAQLACISNMRVQHAIVPQLLEMAIDSRAVPGGGADERPGVRLVGHPVTGAPLHIAVATVEALARVVLTKAAVNDDAAMDAFVVPSEEGTAMYIRTTGRGGGGVGGDASSQYTDDTGSVRSGASDASGGDEDRGGALAAGGIGIGIGSGGGGGSGAGGRMASRFDAGMETLLLRATSGGGGVMHLEQPTDPWGPEPALPATPVGTPAATVSSTAGAAAAGAADGGEDDSVEPMLLVPTLLYLVLDSVRHAEGEPSRRLSQRVRTAVELVVRTVAARATAAVGEVLRRDVTSLLLGEAPVASAGVDAAGSLPGRSVGVEPTPPLLAPAPWYAPLAPGADLGQVRTLPILLKVLACSRRSAPVPRFGDVVAALVSALLTSPCGPLVSCDDPQQRYAARSLLYMVQRTTERCKAGYADTAVAAFDDVGEDASPACSLRSGASACGGSGGGACSGSGSGGGGDSAAASGSAAAVASAAAAACAAVVAAAERCGVPGGSTTAAGRMTFDLQRAAVLAAQAVGVAFNRAPGTGPDRAAFDAVLGRTLRTIVERAGISIGGQLPGGVALAGSGARGADCAPPSATTPASLLRERGVLLLVWIGKGLAMRGHPAAQTCVAALMDVLVACATAPGCDTCSSTATCAAAHLVTLAGQGLGSIVADAAPRHPFSREAGTTALGLYKQRLFAFVQARLAAVTDTAAAVPLLLSLCSMATHLPQALLLAETERVVPIVVRTLAVIRGGRASGESPLFSELRDAVASSALTSLYMLIHAAAPAVAPHLPSVVPVLLALAHKRGGAKPLVRATAIDCLRGCVKLPYHQLHPVRAAVVAGLLPVLDDPKRAVRRRAAVCRNEWITLVPGAK